MGIYRICEVTVTVTPKKYFLAEWTGRTSPDADGKSAFRVPRRASLAGRSGFQLQAGGMMSQTQCQSAVVLQAMPLLQQ